MLHEHAWRYRTGHCWWGAERGDPPLLAGFRQTQLHSPVYLLSCHLAVRPSSRSEGGDGRWKMDAIIDLERYPIHLQTEARTRLVETSRAQLREDGFVSLPNFVKRNVVDSATTAIVQLERDGVGFHSRESHNIFLEEHKVTNQTSSDLHPRFIELKSSKTLLNACDLAKSSIALEHLDTLFSSSLITEFVSEILQTNVHPSVDKYGMYYGNIYNESDGLSWHLDRSQFSISLTLQPSLGGQFEGDR